MLYDLEERVEEAFVAYLQANVTGDMQVYTAFTDETLEYPCAVVMAASTSAVSDLAEYHSPRQMEIVVAVMTEAAPELDATTGGTVRTARERNAAARSDVIGALITSLKTNLIAAAGPGVAFSMAQIGGPVTRGLDEEQHAFVTTIPVDVIAEPVEVA